MKYDIGCDDDMLVGIIGGGSIGLLFGAYLGQEHPVTLFTKREEQAQGIKKNGIFLYSPEKEGRAVQVNASFEKESLTEQDVIIVAVKQYDMPELKPLLLSIPKHIPLCFVQNGMGHLDMLHGLPHETIIVATVEHGAKRLDDQSVSHNGAGRTNLALFKGHANLPEIFPQCTDPHFPVTVHNDYYTMMIEKLVANALINPLTVVFRVKNGRLVENPYYYAILKLMFEEIYSIFPSGNKEQSFDQVLRICTNTKNNTSSMLSDIQAGRKTEIDAILGYILKVAERKGVKLQTVQMIYVMVKGIVLERS
ncbi:2-dehydropantoate 2-reductase [Siminovitchia sediminis]